MTAAQRALLDRMRDHYERRTTDRFFDGEDGVLAEQTAEALRAALGTCGNCRYADTDEKPGWVLCAAPGPVADEFPFIYRLMRVDQRCTGWALRKDDDA